MLRSRPLLILLAAVVLAGSAVLRFTGIGWLLPSLIEQDAHIPVQVQLMDGQVDEAGFTMDWGNYPHFVARLTWLLTAHEGWSPSTEAAASDLPSHLDRACWPVLRVRLVVAFLSLLAVPATWLLARRFLAPGWSLLAAALMGTSLLAVHFGAQARPHGAAVGLDALAVLACMRLRRRGGAAEYALAGVSVAAAIACLQSGLATLLPLAVAHVGVVRERGRSRYALLLVPLACVALAFLAFYPFLFEPGGSSDAARLVVEEGVLEQSKHHIFLRLFNGLGFLLLGRSLWAWEPALCTGALGAVLVCWLTRRQPASVPRARSDRTVLLAFVLPYALVIGLYARSYERFLLPLVPFLAVMTAWGLARAAEWLGPAAWGRVLVGTAAVLLLGFPTLVAAHAVAARLAPSTIDQAAAWVQEHVQPGGETVVVSRAITLPLCKSHASMALDARLRLDRGIAWASYQRLVLAGVSPQPAYHLPWMQFDELATLEEGLARGPRRWVANLPGDLCLNEVYVDEQASLPLVAITVALRDTCEKLARFTPDADPGGYGDPGALEVRLTYQEETAGYRPLMAWRLLHAARFGPVVEVFRLPRDEAAR